MLSSGCQTDQVSTEPPAVQLPATPSFVRTIPEPKVYEGESSVQAIAEHKTVIRSLNKRLVSTKKWYEQVRKDYGSK